MFKQKRLNLFFALLSAFICSNGFSQKKPFIDTSYKQLLDSIIAYNKVDIHKAISFADLYIHKAASEKNVKYQFNGYHLLGIIYFENDSIKKALKTSETYLDFAIKNNLTEELLKAYLLRSDLITKDKGIHDLSVLENFQKGLNTAISNHRNVFICIFLNKISEFHFYAENYEKAIGIKKTIISKIKNIEDSTEIKELSNWGLNLGINYDGIVQSYLKIKNIDSSKYYNTLFKEKINALQKYKEYYLQQFYLNEGEIHLLRKDFDAAEESYNAAFNVLPDSTINQETFRLYFLGKIAFLKTEYSTAITYFEKIDLEKITLTNNYLPDFYKLFSKAYLYNANYKKADVFFEKHLKAIDRRNNSSNNINSKFRQLEIDEYKKEIATIKGEKYAQKSIFIVSFILFLIVFVVILWYTHNQKQKNKIKFKILLQKNTVTEESKKNGDLKPKKKLDLAINELEVKKILIQISKLEKERFYLKHTCTLVTMSKEIQTNTSYLSKIINHHYQKSFSSYINELRINYVLIRIREDKLFRRYSIQSMANDIGFKSKESFNSAFKKHTGILPSYFVKQIEKTAQHTQ